MDNDELADTTTELLIAFLGGQRQRLHTMLEELLDGPRGDSMGVALAFAATIAEDLTLGQGQEYHRLAVTVAERDGTVREGSAEDLPGHARVFSQMIVALANEDRDAASDLFIGYVGDDNVRALHVVTVGLGMAAGHVTRASCLCPPGTHR